ncbi:hypothetical protein TWF696_000480 [Orbilia brochopaga]|uniref:F-box domain-containing protein n=1 Tax=Orbilia brochopaga TaxID=3140254 RepID=A0AAV9VBU1_9PEZI
MPPNSIPLPTELCLSVFAHVPQSALWAFSLCSKSSREIVFLLLFRSIKLSRGSIAAFRDGGEFCDLRCNVSHVTFDGLHDKDTVETFKLARLYCDNLTLFPNIKSLRIHFSIFEALKEILPNAILRRISAYPFYSGLKSISLGCTLAFIQRPFRPSVETTRALFANTDDGGEFFGLNSSWDALEFMELPCPAALEEASIQCPSRISFGNRTHWFPVNPYLFLTPSTKTLRKVTISAKCLYGRERSMGGPIFERVQELHVTFSEFFLSYVFEAVHSWFPNVQDLTIDAVRDQYFLGITVFRYIPVLTELRRARLPWLKEYETFSRKMDIERLEQAIRLRPPGTLGKLQEVEWTGARRVDTPLGYSTTCRFTKGNNEAWRWTTFDEEDEENFAHAGLHLYAKEEKPAISDAQLEVTRQEASGTMELRIDVTGNNCQENQPAKKSRRKWKWKWKWLRRLDIFK